MSNSSNLVGVEATSSDDHCPTPITSKKNDDIIHNNMKELTIVMYKECLKNHAASLGGNAKDGCGEFMPSSGKDGLSCSACGCHRNFHRREVDVGGFLPKCPYYWGGTSSSSPVVHQEVMQCHQSNNNGLLRVMCGPHDLARPSMEPVVTFPNVEEMERNGENGKPRIMKGLDLNKKRHRTRFTSEQKQKMLGFAENAEWRIQKLDERLVQELCQEMGIKRKVFKVWMHNNKQHYVKKDNTTTNSTYNEHTRV